jgi:transcriptional regulator with XRE-family HTH domain
MVVQAETLGQRIRRLRGETGMTLRAMAEKVDKQPSTLLEIEKDRSDPKLSTLRAIAGKLGQTPAELLEGVREP